MVACTPIIRNATMQKTLSPTSTIDLKVISIGNRAEGRVLNLLVKFHRKTRWSECVRRDGPDELCLQ